jgi:hypothetical protein
MEEIMIEKSEIELFSISHTKVTNESEKRENEIKFVAMMVEGKKKTLK